MKEKFSVGWIAGALIAAMMVFAHHASAAAPTYVDKASGCGSSSACSGIAWPAHQANDIGLLVIETANQAITLSGANAGNWTQVTSSPQGANGTGAAGGTTATRLTVWWSRATSSSMGTVNTSDSGDHQRGKIFTFRGVITSGDPWDGTPAGDVASTASTAVSIPGATTGVADTLVVAIVASGADVANPETSAWANGSLTSLTERNADWNTTGNGGGYAIATGVKAVAGAYSATTATLVTSFVQGRISIALRPPCPAVTDLAWVSASNPSATSVTLTFPSSPVIVLRKTSAFTGSDSPLNTNYPATFTLAGGPNGTDLISNSASAISSITDNNNGSGLVAGTKYYYKVVAKAGSCYGAGAVGQTEVSIAPGQTGVAWSYGMSGGSMLKPGIAGQGTIYPSSNAGRILALNTTTGLQTWSPVASTGSQALQGWLTWVPLKPQVWLEEVETGGSSGSTTVVTASPLTAVTGHLYLASVVTTQNTGAPAVSSISGLGLTWTLVKSQCSAATTNRSIEVWKAQGTPSGDGTVTATLAAAPINAAIAVARYSGVHATTPVGNSASANFNGTDGVCTGSTTSSSYTVNLTTTAANSVAFGVVEKGNIGGNIANPAAPSTLRGNVDQGSSTIAGLAIQDETVATAGTVAVDGTTTIVTHLAVVAVEIKALNTGVTTAVIGADQGGNVYAVNAATGAKIWTECGPANGSCTMPALPIQAGVAVQLRDYSNAAFQAQYASGVDIIFAASMNGATTTTNRLYAIRTSDGTLAWSFNGTVESGSTVGEITGMPYVDYARNRVYLATKQSSGRSFWVINSLNGSSVACNGTDCTMGTLDSSPTLSYDGTTIYVGSTGTPGNLYALNANTLALKWSASFSLGSGNGSVRGFVWEDYSTAGRLYLTTTTGKVMCVQDNGAGQAATVCTGWPAIATPTAVAGASTLILLDKIFVGSTDGKVHQINLSTGLEDKVFPAATTLDGSARVGDASSETGNELFVGTDSGRIFKINLVSGALP